MLYKQEKFSPYPLLVCFFILYSVSTHLSAQSSLLMGEFVFEGDTLRYQYRLPRDDGNKKPLLIWLHGKGERGRDNKKPFANGAPAIYDSIQSNPDYDCFFIIPQCPLNQYWSFYDKSQPRIKQSEDTPVVQHMLMQFLKDWLVSYPNADKNRVYGMGISMGGFGIWDIAIRNPGFFAAIIPVCGGADPTLAPTLQYTPVWAWHGEKDKVVNPVFTLQMMHELFDLQQPDMDSRLNVLQGVGHNAWDYLSQEPTLLKWLFEKKNK
ncbi:MAG: hypothetical protein IAE67_08630 [Candidatus Competibacteraceae bacterium]|nr:hypothetical protein [Candidatus Competibacteraceae bacterium]